MFQHKFYEYEQHQKLLRNSIEKAIAANELDLSTAKVNKEKIER